jgi:hypothetical protein
MRRLGAAVGAGWGAILPALLLVVFPRACPAASPLCHEALPLARAPMALLFASLERVCPHHRQIDVKVQGCGNGGQKVGAYTPKLARTLPSAVQEGFAGRACTTRRVTSSDRQPLPLNRRLAPTARGEVACRNFCAGIAHPSLPRRATHWRQSARHPHPLITEQESPR